MSAGEREVLQLSEEIDAVPDEPPLHEEFRELDVVPDTSLYEGEDQCTAVMDPNQWERHIVVPHDLPVDLEEVL